MVKAMLRGPISSHWYSYILSPCKLFELGSFDAKLLSIEVVVGRKGFVAENASRDFEQTTLRGGTQQIALNHWKSTVNNHKQPPPTTMVGLWWVYGGFVKSSESPGNHWWDHRLGSISPRCRSSQCWRRNGTSTSKPRRLLRWRWELTNTPLQDFPNPGFSVCRRWFFGDIGKRRTWYPLRCFTHLISGARISCITGGLPLMFFCWTLPLYWICMTSALLAWGSQRKSVPSTLPTFHHVLPRPWFLYWHCRCK